MGINVELGGLQDHFGAPMNEMTSFPLLAKIPTKLGHDITVIYGETSEEIMITWSVNLHNNKSFDNGQSFILSGLCWKVSVWKHPLAQ